MKVSIPQVIFREAVMSLMKRIGSLFYLLLLITSVAGCSLLHSADPGLDTGSLPFSSQESSTNIQNVTELFSGNDVRDSAIKNINEWQIDYPGDPGIQTGKYTHLPAEELSFIATFPAPMDKQSVEKAFRNNLLSHAEKGIEITPELEFNWINPIQVEIIFPGQNFKPWPESPTFTLSPAGAKSDSGAEVTDDVKVFHFVLAPKHILYHIDQDGVVSRPTAVLPFSLIPLQVSSNGNDLVLERKDEFPNERKITTYWYDLAKKEIKQIYPSRSELPYWGMDRNLYLLTENALVNLNGAEEQWIQFGEYPFIHDHLISPDLNYELFLLSKGNEVGKDKMSILVRDLENNHEEIFENVALLNPPYKVVWIPESKQVYIASSGNVKDMIFDVSNGTFKEAPPFLQVQSDNTLPLWSRDGKYVAIAEKGIYTADGQFIHELREIESDRVLLWNPHLPILAYPSFDEQGKRIVQFHVESGIQVITQGEYTPLAWSEDGKELLVEQKE
jgi:hypothetical protein